MKYSLKSSFTSFNNLQQLNLNIYPDQRVEANADKYLVIILDTSGSMSGGKLESCKKTLIELISYTQNNLNNNKIDLIEFNSEATHHKMYGKDLESQIQIINKLYATGGTEMAPVFSVTKQLLNNQNQQDICIIFLTDGQPNESIQQIQQLSKDLKQFLQKFNSADVHSLGYGSDHEPKLCLALTECNTSQGTFQYVEKIENVQECINSIAGSLGDKVIKIKLKINNEILELRCVYKDGNYSAQNIFELESEEFLQQIKQAIVIIEDQELQMQDLQQIESNDQDDLKAQFINYNQKLKKITNILSNNQIQESQIQEYNLLLGKTASMIFNFKNKIFKFPQSDQLLFKTQYEDLMEYIQTLRTTLKDVANGKISSETIAQINSMACRSTVKENLQKKLDKRILKNIQQQNIILEEVNQIDFEQSELEKKYQNIIGEYGSCYVNVTNIVETIVNKSCFCITFDLIRPEAAINDPSRIKILQINPTYISSNALFECIKYHLEIDPKNFGGFNKQEGIKPLLGNANDKITGAMPIYICKENWQIGKKLIIPILGWVSTLDTNGFDAQQLKSIPFLLFHKAYLEKDKSSFNNKMYKDIALTCRQIIEEDPSFKSHLLNCYENFLINGELRTSQSIINYDLFFKQLVFLNDQQMIYIDDLKMRQILIFALEEDMRRRLKKNAWNEKQGIQKLFKIMNFDMRDIIKKIENTFLDNVFSDDVLQFIRLKYQVQNDNDYFKNQLKEQYQLFEDLKKQYQYWCQKFNFNFNEFKDMGIQENIQLAVLYYQNKIHTQNDNRIKAFQEQTYINFQDLESCHLFVRNLFVNAVSEKYQKVIETKYQEPSLNYYVLLEICQTEDVELAKSHLKDHFDLKSLQVLISILRRQQCKKVFEKLEYILQKKLKIDKKPLKRCLRKLYSKYKNEYRYEEWKLLWFKQKKIKIDNRQNSNMSRGRGGRGGPGGRGAGRGGRRGARRGAGRGAGGRGAGRGVGRGGGSESGSESGRGSRRGNIFVRGNRFGSRQRLPPNIKENNAEFVEKIDFKEEREKYFQDQLLFKQESNKQKKINSQVLQQNKDLSKELKEVKKELLLLQLKVKKDEEKIKENQQKLNDEKSKI